MLWVHLKFSRSERSMSRSVMLCFVFCHQRSQRMIPYIGWVLYWLPRTRAPSTPLTSSELYATFGTFPFSQWNIGSKSLDLLYYGVIALGIQLLSIIVDINFSFLLIFLVSFLSKSYHGPKVFQYEPGTAEKKIKYAWLRPENVIFKGSMGCEVWETMCNLAWRQFHTPSYISVCQPTEAAWKAFGTFCF